MKKREAFTLIELIAVLVILAILALIVTPLVLNIIKKARVSADKRSIDAYGRSIELAIADYLLDNGTFPTSIDQLTIEYSGDEVVCNHATLNNDSSVYLAECTVGGREVKDYTYGKEEAVPTYTAYSVGDEVTYNNVDYYVIEDSNEKISTLILLKAEPLTNQEISEYAPEEAQRGENKGYTGIQYHLSSNAYSDSYIKVTVESWALANAPAAKEARLITIDEMQRLGYEWYDDGNSRYWQKTENTPSWIYNENYRYWTNNAVDESTSKVWSVSQNGNLYSTLVNGYNIYTGHVNAVRPVITISKSVLQ